MRIRAGQPDGKLHPLAAVFFGSHIDGILVRRQDLLQYMAETDFSPGAPGFDIGQYFLQIPHTGSQAAHLSQPLIHLLQALTDLFKGICQPSFQRRLQFFIHHRAHLLKFATIVFLQCSQLGFNGFAHGVKFLFIQLRHLQQLLGKTIQLIFLHTGDFTHLFKLGITGKFQGTADFLAGQSGVAGSFLTIGGKFIPDQPFAMLLLFFETVEKFPRADFAAPNQND